MKDNIEYEPCYSFNPYVENLCIGLKCLPNEIEEEDISKLRECLDDRVAELKLRRLAQNIS